MQNKPSLVINQLAITYSKYNPLGTTPMCSSLITSGMFDVSFHNEPLPKRHKGERATVMYFNGSKIYVDFWDYPSPTFTDETFSEEYSLIIKLQAPEMSYKQFENRCQKKNILTNITNERKYSVFSKITPWTFFHSRMLNPYIFFERKVPEMETERLGFFCGKCWRRRKQMYDKLKSSGIEVIESNNKYKSSTSLNLTEYMHRMFTSKYGIVLPGRGSHFTEAKNRREIDYMALKKPLLLNYKPNYSDPLIEGEHYIYIDEKTDFKSIEDKYNVNEIKENAYEWYLRNASPIGVAKSFMKIMEKKGLK